MNKQHFSKSLFSQLWLPVLFAALVIGALFVGYKFGMIQYQKSASEEWTTDEEDNYIDLILDYIKDNYVDSVSVQDLQQDAIASFLHQLDPHSDFIPPQDFSLVKEQMEGNFQGIGIEFNIIKDTIRVVQSISNGPAEKAGIMAGDKIISVNDTLVAGVHITNNQVFKKLRGRKGTKVKVGVLRNNVSKRLYFMIERNDIPLYSVDVYYMINEQIAYIRIDRFAQNTVKEFEEAMKTLIKKGMKKLVLDLRDNPGGILEAAIKISDHFLNDGLPIVYTQGRKYPRKDYAASSMGLFETQPLVVLINESSASASEIVAGAIQDNDRGTIIGRRSFGKGLVQEELNLPDGSAVRLTVARYYTPTGRCIQKSYNRKKMDEYYMEEYERYVNGEMVKLDSTKLDISKKYVTPKGKILYGGGGIVPDVFVPADTNIHNAKINKYLLSGCIQQYAFNIVDRHKKNLLQMYPNANAFNQNYFIDNKILREMFYYCSMNNEILSLNEKENAKLKTLLKANVGRAMYGNQGYYPIINKDDTTILKAIEILNSNLNNEY